jgi:RNA polymerase sigma-70 factor (ECF subfamily)
VDTSKQEALWVLRAQCGDREALELLLRQIQPALRRYLSGLVGPTDADDLLQEILVLVFRKIRSVSRPELFRPWVFRIASRAGLRHLRKERQRLAKTDENVCLEELVAAETRPTEETLRQLTSTVPPASRAVLLLHFYEDLPLADVAAILDLPLGTVKSRLAYGLSVLRKQLRKERKV